MFYTQSKMVWEHYMECGVLMTCIKVMKSNLLREHHLISHNHIKTCGIKCRFVTLLIILIRYTRHIHSLIHTLQTDGGTYREKELMNYTAYSKVYGEKHWRI